MPTQSMRREPYPVATEPPAVKSSRKLQRSAVNWEKASKAAVKVEGKLKGSSLTFSEVYEAVHDNNVGGVEFSFDQFTPEEKEHLIMRATPLSTATDGFAKQFSSSQSGDAEFKLSRPVEACDAFLSHAWSTDRMKKWCALVYTYNFKASGVAWMLAHVLATLYCLSVKPSEIDLNFKLLCFALVILAPMAVQALILVHGLPIMPSPSIFLDKVCINQNHVGLKALGINGLETFLKYSGKMVLLYDERTYTRLWCAFESAMFSRYADIRDFVLCPCATARFAILMLALSHIAVCVGCTTLLISLHVRGWASTEFFRGLESRDHLLLWLEVFGLVMIPSYMVMAWLLRNRCREIESIQRSLETFRLAETQCFDPNDRKLVEARIAQVWGKAEDFDNFVRTKLAAEMTSTIGAADLPPMWLDLVISLPWMPFFTLAGLLQPASKDSLEFWQWFGVATVANVGIIFPFFLMLWNFFSYKVYEVWDATHPKMTVFMIGMWSVLNCTFGASVTGEILHVAFGLPPSQGIPLLAVFFGAHAFGWYYFHHVEKRTTKGQMTWTTTVIVALYWIANAYLTNPGPASIGCEHWTCLAPHGPKEEL